MSNAVVEVYGCSANSADAEIISGLLCEAGYKVDDIDKIDVMILLTCIVKTPTENKITKRIRELVKEGNPLVVAGCMPQALKTMVEELAPSASMVGPDNINEIVDVVKETIKGNKVVKLNGIAPDRSCQPRIRSNKIIHIVPISSGCLGNCSYCIVKFARGKIVSFPKSNIIKDIQNALSEGCKEIWITAEDTAAYNFEGTTLDKLLKSITDIPMDFKIRVGMMTPNQALKISEGLIEVYKNDKIFKFLHVPVQSGSNEVLMNMNRYYKVEDFKYLISKFRLEISALSVSTDIICGFPGETKEQFNESLELIEWLKPDVLNISKFGLRPRTEAKNMKQIPGYEIKNRSVELTKRWKKISSDQNQTWINWEGEILIDEYGRNLTIVGRNFCYKTIVVDTSSKLGSIINVKVSESRQGYLKGIEISKP